MLQIFSHAVTPTMLSALEGIQHKPSAYEVHQFLWSCS